MNEMHLLLTFAKSALRGLRRNAASDAFEQDQWNAVERAIVAVEREHARLSRMAQAGEELVDLAKRMVRLVRGENPGLDLNGFEVCELLAEAIVAFEQARDAKEVG